MMSSICNFCRILCGNDSILCDICKNWCHFSCTKMTKRQIKELSSSDDPFFCQMCIYDNLPFSCLTKIGFMAAFEESNSKKKTNFLCLLCDKECENVPTKLGNRSVQCDSCRRWTHQTCSAMSSVEFDRISMDNSLFFAKSVCLSFFLIEVYQNLKFFLWSLITLLMKRKWIFCRSKNMPKILNYKAFTVYTKI